VTVYCLQVDYILNHICISKTPSSLEFTPLLLSTVVVTSPMSVTSLCTVDVTAHLLVVLLSSVVTTPQPLGALLWFVYASLQLIVDQLFFPQCGVGQLSLEFGGSHSELHLPSAFGLPAPSVSVPVSMTRCSVVSVTSHSGACLVLV
jgi:hypothetical protein